MIAGIMRAITFRPRVLVRPATYVAKRIDTIETAPPGIDRRAVSLEVYPNLLPVSDADKGIEADGHAL